MAKKQLVSKLFCIDLEWLISNITVAFALLALSSQKQIMKRGTENTNFQQKPKHKWPEKFY